MTTKATYHEKGRAVFLAAMLVLSVFAASAAFAGGAAAAHADEEVTFNDQAIGEDHPEYGDVFVVETVYAHEGQYVAIEDDNGDELFGQELPTDLEDAAITMPVEEPGEYTATVYADEGGEVVATDTAIVYDVDLELSDQGSADGVTLDAASLFDGDGDDTEFDVVLTDADGNELGSATGLTGANEDVTVETPSIDEETTVVATVHVNGEPLQTFDSDEGNFVVLTESATVTPGADDGNNGDEDDEGDNGEEGDDKEDKKKGGDKKHDDKDEKHDKKKGADEKHDDKKHDKKKGADKKHDDKDDDHAHDDDKDDDHAHDGDNGDDGNDGVSNDGETDQDTDAETDQEQDNEQDAEQDESQESEQDNAAEQGSNSATDGMPGFGIVVAVGALLAAAMLALRRQN